MLKKALLGLLGMLILSTLIAAILSKCRDNPDSSTNLSPDLQATLTWLESQALSEQHGHGLGITSQSEMGISLLRYDFDEDERFEATLVNTDNDPDIELILFDLEDDGDDDYARIGQAWYERESIRWEPLSEGISPLPLEMVSAVETTLASFSVHTPIPPTVEPELSTIDQRLQSMDLLIADVTDPLSDEISIEDKQIDVIKYDINEDGYTEVMAMDLDQVGGFEIRLYYVDGDQDPDFAKEDTNRDGRFEETTIYQYESEQWEPLFPNALPFSITFPSLYLP
jgi:hypothetical protein